MRRLELFVLAGLIFAGTANAGTSEPAQATTSSSAQAGVGQASAQAQSSGSASASQSTQASNPKSHAAGASNATSASASTSNSASASAGPATVQPNDSTAVNAVLMNSLDAKKCKPGDKIEARTTSDVRQDGQVVLNKGSRLHGHVTEAWARSKENAESSLGMVFDSVTLKGGEQVPLHLGVQALAASSSEASAALGDDEGMIGGGSSFVGSARATGGLVGGSGGTIAGAAGATGGIAGNAGRVASGTAGATTHETGSAIGNAGGLDATGHLTSSSSGVFGLQGLKLTSTASNATQASLVTSKTQNVHLNSGTEMVLRTAKQ